MKITVIGTGYVGLVTGACLADAGNTVVCFDIDADKIENLKKGILPIYEPGLDQIVSRCANRGAIQFTTDIDYAASHGNIQIIAVGTPQQDNGSANLDYVFSAVKNIAESIDKNTIFVIKSTVPVGTGEKVKQLIHAVLETRRKNFDVSVISNPEFLREGDAIRDFKNPDRVILGGCDGWAMNLIHSLYEPFTDSSRPILHMDLQSSELSKYAANAMLATRISFMNELANMCEYIGADIESVRVGIGYDQRIGPHFLKAGIGYGGSCFPKDVKALIFAAKNDHKINLDLLNAVEKVNDHQKSILSKKVYAYFDRNIEGKFFGIWGLSFKPDTDDMREAPSLSVIKNLLHSGAMLRVYDPVAIDEAKKCLGDYLSQIVFCSSALEAATNVEALLLTTEWAEFKNFSLSELAKVMRNKIVFDGRNLWTREQMKSEGFLYYSIGRP